MVIYSGKYICKHCKKEFLGMEYEKSPMAETEVLPCPYCHSRDVRRKNFLDTLLTRILTIK